MAVIRQVKNRNEAKKIAKRVVEISDKVKDFNEWVAGKAKEEGIDQLKAEIPILNERILNFMRQNDMKRLDLDEDGYVNFIQATGEHVWIGTTAEIPQDAPRGVKSLRKILGKELFMKATRRVVDPTKLQVLIDDGEITEEQVAPAHFTRKRAPYIRYEGGK